MATLFISFDPGQPVNDRRGYGSLARSHASRVGKQHLRHTRAKGQQQPIRPSTSLAPSPPTQDARDVACVCHEDEAVVVPRASDHQPIELWATLSPIFGALEAHLFDSVSFLTAAGVIHEVFNCILPNAYSTQDIGSLFEACCMYPLVFYSYAYGRLWYRDHLQGFLTEEDRRQKYLFSAKAANLLQEKLTTLSPDDFDPVLQSMALMMQDREDLEQRGRPPGTPLLRSHMPWAECVDAARSGYPEGFLPAIRCIVDKAGGLHCLKRDSLIRSLCMADLQNASNTFGTPLFPCYWQYPSPEWFSSSEADVRPLAEGFRGLAFEDLPMQPLACLTRLAQMDSLMESMNNSRAVDEDFFTAMGARNVVQHGVLSLLPGFKLRRVCGRKCNLLVYECCRLAAILYVNTVIRPALPGSAGVVTPAMELKVLLESCIWMHWRKQESKAVFWTICVGGLASHGSQHWEGYVRVLQTYLEEVERYSSEDAQSTLKTFVWSNTACEEGFSKLWMASASPLSHAHEPNTD